MNCSAEEKLANHPWWWQEDVRRRECGRDQKSQEPAGLVGRRTGAAECMRPERGRVESLPTCITVPTQ